MCNFNFSEEPLIVAHRGDSKNAPENTLPAFQLAWKNGADAIEGDIHLTKDGQIVFIHDKNTKRISSRNLVIKNSTLKELRSLDVGSSQGKEFVGIMIPTLSEVLLTIPDTKKIFIEIKCGDEIIPKLMEGMAKSNVKPEQIILISFHSKVIQALKEQAPQFKALWISDFKKGFTQKFTPTLDTVLSTLKQIKADGLCFSKELTDENFINAVIKEGYELHVWTVDEFETARKFKKWGVKSIITNDPGFIKENLAEK